MLYATLGFIALALTGGFITLAVRSRNGAAEASRILERARAEMKLGQWDNAKRSLAEGCQLTVGKVDAARIRDLLEAVSQMRTFAKELRIDGDGLKLLQASEIVLAQAAKTGETLSFFSDALVIAAELEPMLNTGPTWKLKGEAARLIAALPSMTKSVTKPLPPKADWEFILPFIDAATSPPIDAKSAEALLERARQRIEETSLENAALLQATEEIHASLFVTQHKPDAWTLLAEVAFKLGYLSGDDYNAGAIDLALSLLDRAEKAEPHNVEARALRADVLMAARRFKEGSALLDGLDPNHWRAASALARLTEVTANPMTMRTALRSMVAHTTPRRKPMALNSAGSRLSELGRHDEALAMLDEALALTPNSPWPHYNKARVFAAVGRMEEAKASVNQALALVPFPAAQHFARWLDEPAQAAREAKPLSSKEPLCEACCATWTTSPCACGETKFFTLTPREIDLFRRKPCPHCRTELLGCAVRCKSCHKAA